MRDALWERASRTTSRPRLARSLAEITPNALCEQFARSPYAVSFQAADTTVILVTMHVLYGDTPGDRISELTAIARWMAEWAQQAHRWHHNLMLLTVCVELAATFSRELGAKGQS